MVEYKVKLVKFYLNGVEREIVCDENRLLIDVIRSDFALTGTKRGCDNEGYCGACSVIINGRSKFCRAPLNQRSLRMRSLPRLPDSLAYQLFTNLQPR